MILKKIKSWLGNLRFPVLLLITAVLFVANLLIPDALPLVDELLLFLITALLARLKRPRAGSDEQGPPNGDP